MDGREMAWMASKYLDKTTKILLGGIVVAALVIGIGYVASIRANSHVSDLVAQCQAENARSGASKSQDGWENSPLICDPKILRTISRNSPTVGIQAQIWILKDRARDGLNKRLLLPLAYFFFPQCLTLGTFCLGVCENFVMRSPAIK